MKNYFLSPLLLLVFLFLNSCLNCINDGERRYYLSGTKSYIEIENPQNQYQLGDTLWVSVKVPESFKDLSGIPCTIATNELLLRLSPFYLVRTTDTIEYSSYTNYDLPFKKGSIKNSVFNLIKENDFYICTFGFVLDNTSINSLEIYDNFYIYNEDSNESYCGADAKCQYNYKGFFLPVNFSNNYNTKFSFIVLP